MGDRLTWEKVRIQEDANQALPPEMCPEVEVVLAAHEQPHISNLHKMFSTLKISSIVLLNRNGFWTNLL